MKFNKKLLLTVLCVLTIIVCLMQSKKVLACTQLECTKPQHATQLCPSDNCSPVLDYGEECNYCSGTQVSSIPLSGGSSTAWVDATLDCGYWYYGTCSLLGDCVDAIQAGRCWEYETSSMC